MQVSHFFDQCVFISLLWNDLIIATEHLILSCMFFNEAFVVQGEGLDAVVKARLHDCSLFFGGKSHHYFVQVSELTDGC